MNCKICNGTQLDPIRANQPCDCVYEAIEQKRMEDRRKYFADMERVALQGVDNGCTPASMYVMGMLSDVQEMLARGMTDEANLTLNHAKIIIDKRIATKDPQGRHDFSPIETPFRKGA